MGKINLSGRYFELQTEIGNSEAVKIIRIKRNLEDSLFIFKKNYEELKEAIELYYSRKLEKCSFFKKINELYAPSFKQYQKLQYEMNDVIKLMENNPEFQDHNRMR